MRRTWSRLRCAAVPPGIAALVALTMSVGCGRDPAAKIVGWPPREPVVPVREVIEAPDQIEPEDAPLADAGPVEVAAAPMGPCRELAEVACELWTPFADACREAKKSIPDDTHGPTRELCQALVDRYKKDELPRMGNPCGRLARMVCQDAGESSERCRSARARVPLLTKRHQWRACLGDMLWFEARTFRR